MPARRPALDERPDGDAVSVPVASQVGPEEGHVVYLASLERNSSHFLLIEEQNVLPQKIINKSRAVSILFPKESWFQSIGSFQHFYLELEPELE